MRILKSLLLGSLTLLIAVVVLVMIGIAGIVVISARSSSNDVGIGWDPISVTNSWWVRLYFLAAFVGGSLIGYRRLRGKR